MSNRYAPLPNPRSDRDAQHEMDAAFGDDSDDEDTHNITESHPLNPTPSSPSSDHSHPLTSHPLHIQTAQPTTRIPGTYDFENVDYDYPPPGSPPAPSAFALPNTHGNSNGFVPSSTLDSTVAVPSRRGWFQTRVAAVLPSHYVQRLGLGPRRPQGAVGGGLNNDGVFANVTAKPTRPRVIQDGDETYIVPEDSNSEAPPSYATAQADAVPPYWETTVHAPFSPDSIGEMIIDSLPTGSLFSFLWNMLVSISFQFVGFLLTYLLHTSHAARLGSRAGLGVTLIQYGFALRGKVESNYGEREGQWGDWRTPDPMPSTAAEADMLFGGSAESNSTMGNSTMPGLTEEQANALFEDATTEWLSFFLMTVGWFILLTSILGFWRVKRWERGILATQRDNSAAAAPSTATPGQDRPVSQFDRLFGLHRITGADLFRQGFGFGPVSNDPLSDHYVEGGGVPPSQPAREDDEDDLEGMTESDLMIPVDANDPDRARIIRDALANERRLQEDLRAAGLL